VVKRRAWMKLSEGQSHGFSTERERPVGFILPERATCRSGIQSESAEALIFFLTNGRKTWLLLGYAEQRNLMRKGISAADEADKRRSWA